MAGTGVLTFAAAPDFEAAVDSNLDNVYEVIVTVDDGLGRTDVQTLTITVADVDEAETSPLLDADAAADNVDENAAGGTTVGLTLSAFDADGTNNVITYSLDDDAGGRFTVDGNTGVVTVNGSLNYEVATSLQHHRTRDLSRRKFLDGLLHHHAERP